MTAQEYLQLANHKDKYHPDGAYDFDVEKMNKWNTDKSKYRLVRNFKSNGLKFGLYINERKNKYCKKDQNGEYVRIDGELVPYTDEEIERLGWQPVEFSLAIFHDDKKVAMAEDEWGAMLISVAKEYRKFGLGTIIGKMARTLEPAKTSGGFTASGARNFIRVHREFVRDALASGYYTALVRSGKLPIERVKEIIGSVDLSRRQKSTVNLDSSNPNDWLLYTDQYGTFMIYDRKIKDVIEQDMTNFAERMIKAFAYCSLGNHGGIARLKLFGADSEQLRRLLLTLVWTYVDKHGEQLWVQPEEYDVPGFKYGPESKAVGYSSRQILSGPTKDYSGLSATEHKFRKSFDRYGEFGHQIHELGNAKFG